MSAPVSQSQDSDFEEHFNRVTQHVLGRYHDLPSLPTSPEPAAIARTVSSLPVALADKGLGTAATTDYLLNTSSPGCSQGQPGPRYFGFVTGGVTPSAQSADISAGSYDENVQVTLPSDTASTAVEARSLESVSDLIGVPRENYTGRTITTGATSANVLGLACARDHSYSRSPHLPQGYSYAQDGPPSAPGLPSPPIVILALHPHFSITKAAGLVGIGAGPRVIKTIPAAADDELAFDMEALEARSEEEKKVGRGVIVSYGLGEVNTGGFGRGSDGVAKLCRRYGAWLHVDAAFGGFAAVLPELRHLTMGIDQADSLTSDGHKWLNVPYDCGLFFAREKSALAKVFAPPTAPAYLATAPVGLEQNDTQPGRVIQDQVPSPLYCGIENSRRFRALPLSASLMSLGKEGYADIIRRNIEFANKIAQYIIDSPSYELSNPSAPSSRARVPLNIVLFRGSANSPFPPTTADSSTHLTAKINASRRIYVTGTKWRGQGAIRLAVSNWRTGISADDFEQVKQVSAEAMQ